MNSKKYLESAVSRIKNTKFRCENGDPAFLRLETLESASEDLFAIAVKK